MGLNPRALLLFEATKLHALSQRLLVPTLLLPRVPPTPEYKGQKRSYLTSKVIFGTSKVVL